MTENNVAYKDTRSSVINIFPDELLNGRHWLAFNKDKVPIDPSTQGMAYWKDIPLLTYEEAKLQCDLFFHPYIGIIILEPIFNDKGQMLCCCDIDFKKPDVQPAEWIPRPDNADGIHHFMIRASTYGELTVSKLGYHVWFWLDAGGKAPTKNIPDDNGVGIFFHDHAIVMTGNRLGFSETINTIEPSFFGDLLKATGYELSTSKISDKFVVPEMVKDGQVNNYLTKFIGSCIAQKQPMELILSGIKTQVNEGILPYKEDGYVKDAVAIHKRLTTREDKKQVKNVESAESAVSIPAQPNYTSVANRVCNVIQIKDKEGKVTGDRLVFDRQKFTLYIIDKYSTVSFGNGIWIYDEGVYKQDIGEIHKELTSVLRVINDQSETGHLREISSMLLGTNLYTESPFNRRTGLIPVRNGVIKIDIDGKSVVGLIPYSPEYMFTYKLDADYNADAPRQPVLDVLGQWVDPEYVSVLTEIPAIGIVQSQIDAVFKRSCICQGETHSGKSSYIIMLRKFFGERNNTVSSVSIQKMTKNNFSLARMENKLVNMHDDLESTELDNYGVFKEITGITLHDVEEKHKGSRKGRIFCYHLFTCNAPPALPDVARNDPAFFGRWEYIQFPNEFVVDPTYYNRTFTPLFLSGFLNLVLDRLFTIFTTGKITTVTTRDDVMNLWLLASDPLEQFIEECTTPGDKKQEFVYGKSTLFNAYKQWCIDNNVDMRKRITGIQPFATKIQNRGFLPVQRRVKFDDIKKTVVCNVFISGRYWKMGMLQVQPEKPEKLF